MVKPGELYTATVTCPTGTATFICATIVPSNMRRYIYYFEAHVITAAIGTSIAILRSSAATTAPGIGGNLDWFQFIARGQQFWKPDQLNENSLPLAIVEASCRSQIFAIQTTSARIIFAEGA